MTTIITPDPLRKSVEAASEGECTVALRQALIAPCSLALTENTEPLGHVWADNSAKFTSIPIRFGSWNDAGDGGVAALYLSNLRASAGADLGFFLAYIGNVKSVYLSGGR